MYVHLYVTQKVCCDVYQSYITVQKGRHNLHGWLKGIATVFMSHPSPDPDFQYDVCDTYGK